MIKTFLVKSHKRKSFLFSYVTFEYQMLLKFELEISINDFREGYNNDSNNIGS